MDKLFESALERIPSSYLKLIAETKGLYEAKFRLELIYGGFSVFL